MKRFLTAFLAAGALLSLLSCAAPANKAGEQPLPVPVREILRQKLCVDLRYWTSDAIVSNESVTFTVKALDEEIAKALNALRPGAVILFAESCQDGPQVGKLITDIRAEARENGWPDPLLTVDQEGGRVERLTFGPHFHQHFRFWIIRTNQFRQSVLHVFTYCYVAQRQAVVAIDRTFDAARPCERFCRTQEHGLYPQ